jgi:hypothetical protein
VLKRGRKAGPKKEKKETPYKEGVLNPRTGRMVSATGALGRKLRSAMGAPALKPGPKPGPKKEPKPKAPKAAKAAKAPKVKNQIVPKAPKIKNQIVPKAAKAPAASPKNNKQIVVKEVTTYSVPETSVITQVVDAVKGAKKPRKLKMKGIPKSKQEADKPINTIKAAVKRTLTPKFVPINQKKNN